MLVQIWKARWPLLWFALSFQLLENFLFSPAISLLGRLLQGRPVVDSTALVQFFLSPRGFLVLFLGATVSLTIRLVEHAGLSAIVLGALEDKVFRASATFRWLTMELRRLLAIGGRMVGWGLLLAAPPLAVAALLARPLLAKHDINFYLATRPTNFLASAVIIGVVSLAALGWAAWLLIRWRLVVQACVFDRRDGRAAFRDAAALSGGVWKAVAARCLAVLGLQFLLVLAATALQQLALWLVLRPGGSGQLPLALSFGLLILLRTVIGAIVTSFGACADAAVFTAFYQSRRRALGGEPALKLLEEEITARRVSPAWARGLSLAIGLGLVAAAAVSVSVAVDGLGHEGPITVTAHRGVHQRAPENTAAAVREAIAAGADDAEIDVQLTKDGVLVVTHDSDFSRLAGVARKVWDLTYPEIRAIPLGANAAPEFHREPAPTLDEILAIARDHIGLNLELKYYGAHQPRLAERVVEALRASRMTRQVMIQCLEYEPLLEVRRLAPEIPIGYLMSVNASQPGWLEVDFLSVELNRVTGAFIQAAHQHGQRVHVWTVDKPEDMDRMIDLGADDLITNNPAEALRRVRAAEQLTRPERLLRRVHAWLAN
jgi:glycerophosphoryl diester phosphodiesterase